MNFQPFCLRLVRLIILDLLDLLFLFQVFTQLPSPPRPPSYEIDALFSGRTLSRVYKRDKFDEFYAATSRDSQGLFVVDYRLEWDPYGRLNTLFINEKPVFLYSDWNGRDETLFIERCAGDPSGIPDFILPGPRRKADAIWAKCKADQFLEKLAGGPEPGRTMKLHILGEMDMSAETGPRKRLEIWAQTWEGGQSGITPLITLNYPLTRSNPAVISFPSPPVSVTPSSYASTRFIILLTGMAQIYIFRGLLFFIATQVYHVLSFAFSFATSLTTVMGIYVFIVWVIIGRPRIRLMDRDGVVDLQQKNGNRSRDGGGGGVALDLESGGGGGGDVKVLVEVEEVKGPVEKDLSESKGSTMI